MTGRSTVETIWRIEAPRLIGGLVRFTRDLDRAEDLAQDALVAALERWPVTGVPDNPGAWLMTTAKHRAIDAARRRRTAARGTEMWAAAAGVTTDPAEEDRGDLEDDVLRLMFVACHPVLPMDSRVALTLRLVAGLSTAEVAAAFLTTEATMAQRLVRAKRTIAEARVPFDVPVGPERDARIPALLDVLYLLFNEGWSASAGDSRVRRSLCDEALRLGRIVASLAPNEAEVHGLVALMSLHASRMWARVDAGGAPVLLQDQVRARWDGWLIRNGLVSLARAQALARPAGPFTLQAGIAACHAVARTAEDTDWPRIVSLYDALYEQTRSPVVALNRAMAISMADGPAAALPLIEALGEAPAMRRYHWLPSAHADVLRRLGRFQEARTQYLRAAAMTRNAQERAQLVVQAERCLGESPGTP